MPVLTASEYRCTVKAAALPVPGVTPMAVKGDKKVVTTTDEQGLFQFPELADGDWIIDAEMVGFVKVSKRINVGSQAATAE